jgi:hypothetical protein
MAHQLNYKTDYRRGPSLSRTSTTQGWVEYLNTLGQVYHLPQISSGLYKSTQHYLIEKISEEFFSDQYYWIGWIKHLAQTRLADNFVLPIFGSIGPVSNSSRVQCGNSRLAACIVCGILPEQIPMIVFSKSRKHLPTSAERVLSTQQFEQLFSLDKTDYHITFTEQDNGDVEFDSSVLRYTIYEGNSLQSHQMATFAVDDTECKQFWKQFQQANNKIKIQIHGTAQTKSFLVDSILFDIEYVERLQNEWEFSYGMMLGEFDQTAKNRVTSSELQLWLYDVTEPVHLEFMIPWMTVNKNFYKTQNEKAVIIYGRDKSNGVQVIGNWVK